MEPEAGANADRPGARRRGGAGVRGDGPGPGRSGGLKDPSRYSKSHCVEYRVEELARAAGVGVDTVRFYQGRGLLPKPRRRGRVALYDERHLRRLRRIRELLAEGFTLAQIGRLLARGGGRERSLLHALEGSREGARTWSLAELAAEAGIPEALVAAACSAGLMEPVQVDGKERFGEADLRMARAALALLRSGIPLDELLRLAIQHNRRVAETCDRAIDLFDEHVRKAARPGSGPAADTGGGGGTAEESATAFDDFADPASDPVVQAFRELLPEVTRLVALHFQRTLIDQAIERLRASGEEEALREALDAAFRGRLDVRWSS